MFRLRWHTVFIAALTLGLLWLFFRNIELHETWRAITHARPGLILLRLKAAIAIIWRVRIESRRVELLRKLTLEPSWALNLVLHRSRQPAR